MTSKERAGFRSMANTMQPIFQIGKNGISDNTIKQVDDALEARELIKINLLNSTPDDKHSIANELAEKTDSDVVQIIGKKITLYKRSTKTPKIELP